jgi:MFS family permease
MVTLFPVPDLLFVGEIMVRKKRIAISTAIGILTGLYCAGSLLVFAPPGVTPEPWFMVMIFYGRTIQGFVIGFADGIPLHPVVRGAALGAIFSLLLCIVPLFAHNYTGAGLLFVFGIIYGVIADWIASQVIQKEAVIPIQ